MLENKKILLVISGGIAAYKSLDLIRLIQKAGGDVTCILTNGGKKFVTPLSVSALSGNPVFDDLWALKNQSEMSHIQLSRETDLVVIAPASASLMARVSWGMGDDLASAVLLATNKPVMMAPAMNPVMWSHFSTQNNLETLRANGIDFIGPNAGLMACGESGPGRMAEPEEILGAILRHFNNKGLLAGRKALVTSGPTYEPIDPVRFIGNRSSGKQGHAIARALRDIGADVTLITGPVSLPDPSGITTIHVETAVEMLTTCRKALPVDIAVCAAAVSDWSAVAVRKNKIKKQAGRLSPDIRLKENPDILATLARPSPKRPDLVVGFAAETENLLNEAAKKHARKGCDWIVANDVSPENNVFRSDENHVYLLTGSSKTEWRGTKDKIAENIAARIARYFEMTTENTTQKNKKEERHGTGS